MVPWPFWKGLSASVYLGWGRFSSVCSGRWPPHSVCSQSLLYNFRLNTGGQLPGLLLLHWAPSSSCVFSSVYLVTLLFKKQLLMQVRADGSRRGLSALLPRDRAQSAQPAGLPQPGLRARSVHPLSPWGTPSLTCCLGGPHCSDPVTGPSHYAFIHLGPHSALVGTLGSYFTIQHIFCLITSSSFSKSW